MQQDNRATSTRKNIRFNNELLVMIDKARGNKAFGTWIQDLCKNKVKMKKAK